jgi:hypothetical protein
MWAADTVAMIGHALSVPPGVLPLPPATAAAARHAVDVLTTVDTFTAVLLKRGPDPALDAALAELASASGAVGRANQPGRPETAPDAGPDG